MKDTETIDQRLRKRAKEKATEEVNAAAKPLRDFLARSPESFCIGDDYAQNMINTIVSAVIEAVLPRYEKQELDQFLGKLDRLDAEVQDLRHEYES